MNFRFLLSSTVIIGLLMPSLFYAMDPFLCKVPRTEHEKVEGREKHALLEKMHEGEHDPRPLGAMQSVTLVPKKESFVIAPDKKIQGYHLKQIAMDQNSDGQLLVVSLEANNRGFIYAINLQKKTWQLIYQSNDLSGVRSVRVCEDTVFITIPNKIIRWDASKKEREKVLVADRGIFADMAIDKDMHGRRIAVVGGFRVGDSYVMDVDTQHVIDRMSGRFAWSDNVAIAHLSNGETVFAETMASDMISVKIVNDKKPPLVIRKVNSYYGNIFLYEDDHKRLTLISYDQVEGLIDVYDVYSGTLCKHERIKYGGNFEFRRKDGRTFMAVSRRDASSVDIFDISNSRDTWKKVTTCAVNDAHGYKKLFGMYIDDFGYPHLASITQPYGAACWPLQLWEPKERAQTLAQIKSALRTHLAPEGIAHTILGYAGSAEYAHAIDRYNAQQQQSEQQEPEIPIAPIGAEGLSEGRLQLHEGPPPAHPSWFVRNQKWLNWVALGCSIVPLVMLVMTIIKNRRG